MSGGFPLAGEICNTLDFGTVNASTTGTALTGGANNTKGSWTQLIAAASIDIDALCIMLAETSNTTRHAFVDIGIGGAGSEKVICSNLLTEGGTNGQNATGMYLFPIHIAAGTRIAARAQNGSAVADGPNVSLIGFQGSFDSPHFAGVDDIGSVTATTYSTLLTSAGANVEGTYTQLIAATAVDYAGFWVRPSGNSSGTGCTKGLIDIAIGASSSEQNIIQNLQVSALSVPVIPNIMGPFWIPIPAGTRISARLQAAQATTTCGLELYGIYR